MLIFATTPVIKPLRNFAKSPQAWALICLLVAYILTILKNYLIVNIAGYSSAMLGLLVYSAGELIRLSVYIFIGSILISIIASWVAPYSANPLLQTVRSLSEPILLPARRLIPSFGGIDVSPIAIILSLNLTLALIVDPILDTGMVLGFPLHL